MIEIKDLLSRFSKVLLSQEAKREAVRKTISEVAKIDILPENIKIKGNTVYLDIKPIYKNEIFLKQEKIISKLRESFGKNTPSEIR